MKEGRVYNAKRNIAFAYLGTLVTAILGFVVRRVFILRLSDTLLGVNDYYTGILSVLSLAELGIGTALNFGLYKPVAMGDTEKIKSYMALYRKAYRIIALVIAVAGLAIAPFLGPIIKDPGENSIRDLTLYYLIFLFNTATSYLVAYKYSLVNAEQKTYIQTNIITITKLISVSLQIIVLLVTGSFYAFLLTDAAVQLLQKIFVSRYLDRRYPYLADRDVTPLTKEENTAIVEKTKALMWLKIGDIARLQTDSIIITAFIGAAVTSFNGHFTLVVNTISNFVNAIFNAALPGFGNLIATESKEKQYSVFNVYRFFANWIYGYVATGFIVLLIPLITMIFGEERAFPLSVVSWMVAEFYFKGDRTVLSNFKTAAGVFEQDKYLALIQGAVNLVISIALVKTLGIVGVYIGTVISGLIANVVRPPIIYRVCFDRGAAPYFISSARYRAVMLISLFPCLAIGSRIMSTIDIPRFILTGVVITVIYHAVFLAFFGRTEELKYLKGAIKR